MISRRLFLARSAGWLAAAPFIVRASGKPLRTLGLIADLQYADKEAWNTRFYRNSLSKLAAALKAFKGMDLDACVNLGDLIDQDWKSFDPVLKLLGRSRRRFLHVLGNHDFEVAAEFKARVATRLGGRHRYREVRLGEFCVLVLDTNEVSTYAYPESSRQTAEARGILARLTAAHALNAQPWNGAVGPQQLAWLERACQRAERAGQKVIILAHHPVLPDNPHNTWNAADMLEVLARHRNIVAWFNGHNHQGAFGAYEGVPCVTFKGMVETADQNAFAVVKLYADRLELIGYGREVSRDLPFRTI